MAIEIPWSLDCAIRKSLRIEKLLIKILEVGCRKNKSEIRFCCPEFEKYIKGYPFSIQYKIKRDKDRIIISNPIIITEDFRVYTSTCRFCGAKTAVEVKTQGLESRVSRFCKKTLIKMENQLKCKLCIKEYGKEEV